MANKVGGPERYNCYRNEPFLYPPTTLLGEDDRGQGPSPAPVIDRFNLANLAGVCDLGIV